jgi:hypothetical protein
MIFNNQSKNKMQFLNDFSDNKNKKNGYIFTSKEVNYEPILSLNNISSGKKNKLSDKKLKK